MSLLGMLASDDVGDDDQRPKSWRDTMYRSFPNGQLALTALTSKMKKEKVDDYEFKWWVKELQLQRATITGWYTDVGLGSAYAATTAAAGTVLYVKMAAADVAHFKITDGAVARHATDRRYDCVGKVVAREANGDSSYVGLKLLQADPGATYSLKDTTVLLAMGTINPQGGEITAGITYDPAKRTNYTEIFREPFASTRTAKLTRYRTG